VSSSTRSTSNSYLASIALRRSSRLRSSSRSYWAESSPRMELAQVAYLSLRSPIMSPIGLRSRKPLIRELVTPDMAETTTTFLALSLCIMEAVLSMASTPPTLVPPNFITLIIDPTPLPSNGPTHPSCRPPNEWPTGSPQRTPPGNGPGGSALSFPSFLRI